MSFSRALQTDQIADFAEMAGVEVVVIAGGTSVRALRNELRWNAAFYHLSGGL